MTLRGWKMSAACFLLGTFFLTLLPWIGARAQLAHWELEPNFACPITTPPGGTTLRSDAYGKGYFGASRNGGRKHLGIDLSIEVGQPVFASKSGRVSFAGFDKGYGNYLEIAHPGGFSTRYAHLSQLFVAAGDWLPQGSVIGLSGKTGNADHKKIKPHLHFEIHYSGKPLNPQAAWLSNQSLYSI